MTPAQAKLHQYLIERIDDPVSPTYEEMRHAMGRASKSGVKRVLDTLVDRGLVTRGEAGQERTVRAVRQDVLAGVPTAALIAEVKRRGEWPHGR